jgi:indoleamine 2,3-dioxygenase
MDQFARLKPLEDYDISVETGFLPSKPPLRRLSDDYFAPWEDMMDDFNGLLLAGKLREKVHKVRIKSFCFIYTYIYIY